MNILKQDLSHDIGGLSNFAPTVEVSVTKWTSEFYSRYHSYILVPPKKDLARSSIYEVLKGACNGRLRYIGKHTNLMQAKPSYIL